MEIWYYDDEAQVAYTDIGPIPYNKLIVIDSTKFEEKDEQHDL